MRIVIGIYYNTAGGGRLGLVWVGGPGCDDLELGVVDNHVYLVNMV